MGVGALFRVLVFQTEYLYILKVYGGVVVLHFLDSHSLYGAFLKLIMLEMPFL